VSQVPQPFVLIDEAHSTLEGRLTKTTLRWHKFTGIGALGGGRNHGLKIAPRNFEIGRTIFVFD